MLWVLGNAGFLDVWKLCFLFCRWIEFWQRLDFPFIQKKLHHQKLQVEDFVAREFRFNTTDTRTGT
jgi:hypothetical protein